MSGYLFVLAAGVMAGVAILFVWHEQYDDCLLGRIALSIIAVSGLITVVQWWRGWQWDPTPNTTGLVVGAAAFMAWLAFRFLRREHRRKRRG